MRITRKRSRRGVAGIVATVIMFAILFTVGTSYFLFTNGLDQKYVQSLVSRDNNMNILGSENMVITTQLTSAKHLEFYINNTGGVSLNATVLLVYSSTGTPLVCIGKNLPAGTCTTQYSTLSVCQPSYSATCSSYLAPAPTYMIYVVGKDGNMIDTRYTYSSGTVTVKVITARGSVFTGTYPSAIAQQQANEINSQVANSIGSLLINQESFRFYYGASYSYGDGYIVSGFDAFAIPASTAMVFSISITNADPLGRSITLNEGSILAFGNQIPLPGSDAFYIIASISDSSPYTAGVVMTAYSQNSPITIAYKATTTIYFGSQHAGTAQSQNSIASGSPIGIFLLMYGTYSDNTIYSQTIPFEATYSTAGTVTAMTGSGCAGTTYTANLQGSTWNSGPNAYYVPVASSGAGTLITVGTPTNGQVQYKIPAGTATGYYQVYLTDTINAAYFVFHVTC